MPKPIYMTDTMIEECLADIRATFEKKYKDFTSHIKEKKTPFARGSFSFPEVTYEWTDDNSRAKVILEPLAFSKICLLMYNTDKEIGWHGLVSRDEKEPNLFHVEDVILFPQTVTSVTVQTDDSKYSNWVVNLPDDKFRKLRFHGHSHVNMAVSPSGTDLTYYSSLIKQFKDGFYVFMIINKKMDIYCQVYDFDNNSMYETDEVDVEIGDNLISQMKADTKEMVSNQSSSYPSYGSYDYQRPSSQNWGPRYGSWKKDEPASQKDSKKGKDKDKDKPVAGQGSLDLPPYLSDGEEQPWWRNHLTSYYAK